MALFDVIIVGGGASGLMCAAVAAQGGKQVLVLEHNTKCGRKVLASGGGNCNFTNLDVGPGDFQSSNPHFAKSALSRYPSRSFIELIEEYGVTYFEKKMGQLFCKEGAERVLDVLLGECKKEGVTVTTGCEVNKVSQGESHFTLTAGPHVFEGKNLVMATGGLSFKGLGATDFGYRVAAQFGLNRITTTPALVPLLCGGYKKLAGLSLPVAVSVQKKTITDDFLFTHWGFSGPAILKASLYWESSKPVSLDFLPGQQIPDLIEAARHKGGAKSLNRLLSHLLPSRFLEYWLEKVVPVPDKDLQNYTQKEIKAVSEAFHAWTFVPQGTEGYKKAEVTKGGIDTNDLSSKTMEAKAVKGLYFIGELVDVTGLLGGYNFQWAWSSGFAAGKALAGE